MKRSWTRLQCGVQVCPPKDGKILSDNSNIKNFRRSRSFSEVSLDRRWFQRPKRFDGLQVCVFQGPWIQEDSRDHTNSDGSRAHEDTGGSRVHENMRIPGTTTIQMAPGPTRIQVVPGSGGCVGQVSPPPVSWRASPGYFLPEGSESEDREREREAPVLQDSVSQSEHWSVKIRGNLSEQWKMDRR